MLNLEFTTDDIHALRYERFHYPVPRVQQRIEVVFLHSQGFSQTFIAQHMKLARNTVAEYLASYHAGGLAALKETRWYQPQSDLEPHRASLEAYFAEHPPASVNQAKAVIAALTGIARSPTQVRVFLRRSGLRCRRVGQIPAKADPVAQAAFVRQELEPRLAAAAEGQRQVWFVDAAHFVLGAFLGWLWTKTRVFVRAPSGRQRFNVLGALNVVTHQLAVVSNTTYITAFQVCQLLTQLREQAGDQLVTVVLDNARYQRCRLVTWHAAQLGIEVLFLPPYSPNLNLIERLWKFVKKQCLYGKYYEQFGAFQGAIEKCLREAPEKHEKEFRTLFRPKFQTFADAQIVTV